MAKFAGLYDIRDMRPDDRNFILATFLKGLYHGDSWFSQIPWGVYMENYKIVANAMLDSPKNVVKVACLKDDPDTIIGYSILSADFQTIHWVQVKEKWRHHGVGRSLVPQYPTAVTHLTKLGGILLPKLENCIFNPFKL